MSVARNWLITGGCGFIGSALTARLLAAGGRVRIVDDLSVGSVAALPRQVGYRDRDPVELDGDWGQLELIRADVRAAETALGAAVGADVIVHLAASTGVAPSIEAPRRDCEVNIIGTLNYLEAARVNDVKRFVFASSGAPLGEQEPPLHENKVPRPISPYGASKLAGEAYCSAYWGSFGIETVALRFGNVYGPGSAHKESVVSKFLRRALTGEVLEVYGDGTQTRDFIYIDDIVEAIELAANRPGIGGEVFHIATQKERTVNEIAQLVAAMVGERLGRKVVIQNKAPRRGEVRRSYADVSKARERLGFVARQDIRAGLSETLDYLLRLRAAA